MPKIKIIDSEYSKETSNERLAEVISSYNGFRRGVTRKNYPNFMQEVYRRTQFFFDIHRDKKDTTSARLDLVERGIFSEEDIPLCVICNENPIMPLRQGGLSECCSTSCAAKLSCKNSEETNMRKRGVRHHSQDPAVLEKISTTLKERYGDDVGCPMDIPSAKEKAKNTWRENYGADHHMQVKEICESVIEKQKNSEGSIHHPNYHEKRREKELMEGKSHYLKSDKAFSVLNNKETLEEYIRKMSINSIASLLDVNPKTVSNYAEKHGIEFDRYRFGNRSGSEMEVEDYITSFYCGDVIPSYRGIDRNTEIDIYLPDCRVGIEFNGILWHSENPRKSKNHTPKRHIDKTLAAKGQGIRLIHVFEDEWMHKREQTKHALYRILSDRERNKQDVVCEQVPPQEARAFLEEFHLEGQCDGDVYVGIYSNHSLIDVMAFGDCLDGVSEVMRIMPASHPLYVSMMIDCYREKNPHCKQLVLLADRRWYHEEDFEMCGFELADVIDPDYCYVFKESRLPKWQITKDMMKNYDESLTFDENAWNHRIYRIYDCGLLKYVKTL